MTTGRVHLERETITIQPDLAPCHRCVKIPPRIGDEVTEEIHTGPPKLIRRRIVRPKHACPYGEAKVEIAPLPPRLIPQSKVGLGLAVHIFLARFDDHLSLYRLEPQSHERHSLIIPRQQMVQWVESVATWLRPIYDAMWREILTGVHLQVDERPIPGARPRGER